MVEENEFCLEETAKVLTLGTGEAAVANHIVGYVQDYFRLESLERIEETSCVGPNCARKIYTELKKLLDANVADEAYVKTFLSKLKKIVGTKPNLRRASKFALALSLRKLAKNNGMNLVVECMNMYPRSKSVTLLGSFFLTRLSMGLCWGVLERDEVEEIYCFLMSDSCMEAVIGTLKNHQDNQHLLIEGMTCLSYLGAQVWCSYQCKRQMPAIGLGIMYLKQLEQKNVIPLCWDLLQKQILWDNPTWSDAFCSYACCVLTLNVGGVDRPILKKLLAEAPPEMVDEIISRTHGDIGFTEHVLLYKQSRKQFRHFCHVARLQGEGLLP